MSKPAPKGSFCIDFWGHTTRFKCKYQLEELQKNEQLASFEVCAEGKKFLNLEFSEEKRIFFSATQFEPYTLTFCCVSPQVLPPLSLGQPAPCCATCCWSTVQLRASQRPGERHSLLLLCSSLAPLLGAGSCSQGRPFQPAAVAAVGGGCQ